MNNTSLGEMGGIPIKYKLTHTHKYFFFCVYARTYSLVTVLAPNSPHETTVDGRTPFQARVHTRVFYGLC